jgi:hypothetical protein
MTEHTTFGTVEVLADNPWLGKHHVLSDDDSVYVDQSDVRAVRLKFGFSDTRLPLCGKCRSPIRPVERVGEQVVWLAEVFDEWTPYCADAVAEDGLGDDVRIDRMWHEPDRSVGSWCKSAAIRINDETGALTFHVRTHSERVVIRLTRRPNGEAHIDTSRTPRRRRLLAVPS